MYQPFNRLVSANGTSFGYDTNGNQISKVDGSGSWTYSWDYENRLNQESLSGSVVVTNSYDALGRRVQRSSTISGTIRFIYDGPDVVRDLDGSGNTIAEYTNGLDIDDQLRQVTSGASRYPLADHIGTLRLLTDASGNATSGADYDSFGRITGGSILSRYSYTGRELDTDTGLMYYRARWYQPVQGRFMSEDPVGFSSGTLNIYSYVGNNPVSFNDPNGLWETKAHERIIDSAFKNCLNAAQRQKLKDASAYVDGLFNGGQSEWYAYQHGMRGGPNQSETDARNAAASFMQNHGQMAKKFAPKGCQGGYENIRGDALWEFGQMLHTVTDMTSPAHEGFQTWYGPPYPTGFSPYDAYRYSKWAGYVDWHHKQETDEVLKSNPRRLREIVQAAQKAFADVFGDCGCCDS